MYDKITGRDTEKENSHLTDNIFTHVLLVLTNEKR